MKRVERPLRRLVLTAFVDAIEPRISDTGARMGRTVRDAQDASVWLFERFATCPDAVSDAIIEVAFNATSGGTAP